MMEAILCQGLSAMKIAEMEETMEGSSVMTVITLEVMAVQQIAILKTGMNALEVLLVGLIFAGDLTLESSLWISSLITQFLLLLSMRQLS